MKNEPTETQREIERLERLAGWLDARFRIPGTGIRFGLDAIIGLIPGVGDAVTLAPAGYLIYRASSLGVSKRTRARMLWNTAIDLAVGTVPLIGDLLDIGVRSNSKNVELLRRELLRSEMTNEISNEPRPVDATVIDSAGATGTKRT